MLKKVSCQHIPILFSLWLLTDTEYHENSIGDDTTAAAANTSSYRRHLAVFTALQRHPPSARIFRCLFQFVLLGFCASLSIHVWESIIGKDLLGRLLFEIPYTLEDEDDEKQDHGNSSAAEYELAEQHQKLSNEKFNDEKQAEAYIQNDDNDNDDDSSAESADEDDLEDINLHPINSKKIVGPPDAGIVLNGSLDALMLILAFLFLFTISSSAGGEYIDQTNPQQLSILSRIGDIAAPVFPLVLFFICIVQLFFPWTKPKKYFWTVILYTMGAPLYEVTFRDGFIGDIFTSTVRPLQDLAFTTFYLMSGLQGWWTFREKTTEDHILVPVERSWLLHTVILPACLVSPLWWRFLQTLRQVYVNRQRWPYLGNSAKYFFAAQVVIFGVFDPERKKSILWMLGFVCSTLYQYWWDIFLDWKLLEFVDDGNSSFFPYTLRKKRLFKSKGVYICIAVINFFLRFGWTLNFIPNRYLSQSGALLETFSTDFTTFIGPALATLEILRRTLWGFLRVELEAIEVMEKERQDQSTSAELLRMDGSELTPMSIKCSHGDNFDGRQISSWSSNLKSSSTIMIQNDLSTTSEVQILWELCLYATIFSSMGILEAVHRTVL